jgi:hypothetical protein
MLVTVIKSQFTAEREDSTYTQFTLIHIAPNLSRAFMALAMTTEWREICQAGYRHAGDTLPLGLTC